MTTPMMTAEDLHDCADAACELGDALSGKENADGETVTRGLFVVAASLSGLTAAAYEIAASLRKLRR
jgi:hypothetical protein